MEKWFYAVGDQRLGPIDAETLANLARSGELSRSQLVWRKGLTDWTEAGQVDALAPLFPAQSDPALMTIPPELPARRATHEPRPTRDTPAALDAGAAAAVKDVPVARVAHEATPSTPHSIAQSAAPQPPSLPAPTPPSAEWFRAVQGAPNGPLTLAEMQRLVRGGELRPEDLVWRIGTVDWVRAGSVPALCSVPPPVAAPNPPAKAVRPSKVLGVLAALTLYSCGIVAGVIPFVPDLALAGVVALPLMIAASLTLLRFVYQMWRAIDDGQTSIRPGAAAGLMLVPLFNLYWVFRVFPGLATELEAYARRHERPCRPLNRGILVTYAVLFVVGMLPWVGVLAFAAQLVVAPIAIVSICNAIDALHAPTSAAPATFAQPARA